MRRLQDKVALIAGASAGIGRATALLFAEHGARLVVGARGEAALSRLVDELRATGTEAIGIAGDVRDEAWTREMVSVATRSFGRLDVAFNNAATIGLGATTELSSDSWRDTIEANLNGAFYGAKQQIPALLATGGGSLIFTSSFVGHTVGIPGAAAYAASKAGLVGLTQALAAEFGPQGLRVNALLPGGTDTAMAHAMNPSAELMDGVRSLHALRRIAQPSEIAEAVLFLASDASSFMTGTAMLVDGGVSIFRG